MDKIHRLKENKDFQRVFQKGKSAGNRHLVLYYLHTKQGNAYRVGLSVSKKVGNAVVRNRVKRLLRETVTDLDQELAQEYDLVFIARPSTKDLDFDEIKKNVAHLLKKVGLLEKRKTGISP